MAQTNEYVQYELQENVATIRIDDGKRNALSPQLLREIYQASSCVKSIKHSTRPKVIAPS
jgi:enoyl-CoA hydratase/carnithine racemase